LRSACRSEKILRQPHRPEAQGRRVALRAVRARAVPVASELPKNRAVTSSFSDFVPWSCSNRRRRAAL
jgi:hypothetical protein